MRRAALLTAILATLAAPRPAAADPDPPLSNDTRACLACHGRVTPGIVADWRKSPMSRTTPAQGLARPEAERRVSAATVPGELRDTVVGCAECHRLGGDAHGDAFDHMGYRVHVVVTPRDCATCHAAEAAQYDDSLMARARTNLTSNPLAMSLVRAGAGPHRFEGTTLVQDAPDAAAQGASCFACHGTAVTMKGTRDATTSFGPAPLPVLEGWPNEGCGRANPDGSRGSCSVCHPRHSFSVAAARQPHTCGRCHGGPDAPAYHVYRNSVHGALVASGGAVTDWGRVPWRPGPDLTAPTCATCHMSLLTDEGGGTVAPRTHALSDRLPWRLFGVPYAQRHPLSPDTSAIRNGQGQPLASDLDGTPAAAFLVDEAEAGRRSTAMKSVCRSCHARTWVEGHFARLDGVVAETNEATRVATRLLQTAWTRGRAAPADLFDEPLERRWTEVWLFHANNTRLGAAMGGWDHGAFENGRWQMNREIRRLADDLR